MHKNFIMLKNDIKYWFQNLFNFNGKVSLEQFKRITGINYIFTFLFITIGFIIMIAIQNKKISITEISMEEELKQQILENHFMIMFAGILLILYILLGLALYVRRYNAINKSPKVFIFVSILIIIALISVIVMSHNHKILPIWLLFIFWPIQIFNSQLRNESIFKSKGE